MLDYVCFPCSPNKAHYTCCLPNMKWKLPSRDWWRTRAVVLTGSPMAAWKTLSFDSCAAFSVLWYSNSSTRHSLTANDYSGHLAIGFIDVESLPPLQWVKRQFMSCLVEASETRATKNIVTFMAKTHLSRHIGRITSTNVFQDRASTIYQASKQTLIDHSSLRTLRWW